MNIAGTIRKSILAIVSVAATASSLMGAPTDKPKITDTLNDFNPEYPIGIFVQEIVSNQVVSSVILTNGVLSVGSETIAIAQTSHDVVETNVVSGTLVITTNTYYIVYEDGLAKTLKAYATNEKITSIVTNDIGEVTTNWTKVAYLSDIPPAEKKADKMMQTWEFLEPNMDVVLSMTPNTNAPFAYWKWAGDKEAFQSIALYYKEGSWHVSQNGGAFVSTEGDFTNNVVEVGGFTFIATNRAEVMVVYSDQLEDVVIGKLDQYVTNTVNNLIASATNGLLRTESDPMFTAWTNGTATLSGAFVQGAGFKNALVNNPILASGARAHAQGYATRAYGDNSHAEGTSTVASNMNSHAEGEYTKALGRGSHAEGYFAVASNDYSHAEGDHTVAGGILSHAGGSYSRAWGDTSRAWGIGATANAAMSVSEGNQTQANGWYSTARGYSTIANGVMSHAEGVNAIAEGNPIFSAEDVSDPSDLDATYAWSAVYIGEDTNSYYRSHGPGTYNINPSGGLAGFYVGETNLQTLLGEKASTGDVQAAISAVNPTFSNAVLAVGLNIDTNSVAVLNEIAATFGGFPIEGTATTIGGLLAALAAAIAWLRRNKADKTDLEGFATEADLLAFYYPDGGVTSMDQITTSGIEYAVGSDGGAYVAKGDGLSGHVVLPWKVTIGGDEYKVTAIEVSAFNDGGFTGLTAPTTVKTIGNSAFSSCASLTSINIPSATSIGDYAFNYCSSLTSIDIPSATSIGAVAFGDCGSLTSVNIPSATSIGDYAFEYCGSLASVDFGSSPKSAVPLLSGSAFEGVPTSCKFIIPIGMYDEWIAASGWSDLYARGYKFEGYASTAQLANKADKTALDELAAKVDNANAALEEVA